MHTNMLYRGEDFQCESSDCDDLPVISMNIIILYFTGHAFHIKLLITYLIFIITAFSKSSCTSLKGKMSLLIERADDDPKLPSIKKKKTSPDIYL